MSRPHTEKCRLCSKLVVLEAQERHGSAGTGCWNDAHCHQRRSYYRSRDRYNQSRCLKRQSPENTPLQVPITPAPAPVLHLYRERVDAPVCDEGLRPDSTAARQCLQSLQSSTAIHVKGRQNRSISNVLKQMMKTQGPEVKMIDFSREQTSDFLLPHPAFLKSSGWDNIHFELHQQPKFETPEHRANWHVIAHCPRFHTTGERSGERWLDGKLKREARHEGDIAIIPAGISQSCNWRITAQFTIVAIDPALLKQVGQDWVNPDSIELIPQFMTEQDALIQGIIAAMREEVETDKAGGYLLVDSLKTTLAIYLLRNYCTTQPKLSSYAEGLSKSTLQQVTEYIQDQLHQDVKLIELAAIAQMSPYHFLRLFKQSMGVTPHQYILQRRIEKAKYFLQHSQLNIADIALRVGFCDQSHFTRCFKRRVGMTPKQLLKA